MSPTTVVAFIALLVAVLLFVMAVVVWQEARRRPSYEPLTYVVEDAVKHVESRLADEGGAGLDRGDIRRILEWEVFYLQGLAQDDRRQPVETVAGGVADSISYISTQIEQKHGVAYSEAQVAAVLRYEADYLERIGAVGAPVDIGDGEEE